MEVFFVKCLVISMLSHDGQVYQPGSEAMLPLEVAKGLAEINVVKIQETPIAKNQTETPSPIEPVKTVLVEEFTGPVTKKK